MIIYGVQECSVSENTIEMEVLTPLPTFAISHSNYCGKNPNPTNTKGLDN
jgi:hypothetical protein